ncbi:isochorismate synthase [Rhodomicrobium sp.]|uniref:isochorismate synthase n=1 Tax=Rhodomicrobium sp. TaxID=2720632 RepID=UPI0039E3CA21
MKYEYFVEDDLLYARRFDANTLFYSSNWKTISGPIRGSVLTSGLSDQSTLKSAIARAFADTRDAHQIVAGAVPFSRHSSAKLYLLRDFVDLRPKSDATPVYRPIAVDMSPHKKAFAEDVARALELFGASLCKVVLARALDIALAEELSLSSLIANLLRINPSGYTFAVPAGIENHPYVFVGASPELLLRKKGMTITTNPLAGSIKRGKTPEEDEARAKALLHSAKNRHEHALVVSAVRDALVPFCETLDVPDTPSLIKTPTVWHLSTTITGYLSDPRCSSLDLAFALHPTPAVCGYPTESAMRAINSIESFDRELYAGFVGWMDASGDGEWAVALRCANVARQSVKLFAGAGIVPGSLPLDEAAEIEAKFATVLGALGFVR